VIMSSISTIHAVIRNSILIFIAVVLSLIVWLYEGVSIDRLKLYNIDIDGLYLKLDKKLILKVDQISIKRSKKAIKVENIDEIFDRIKNGFTFFEFVQLKNVNFDNNHYYVNYVNGILHINSDEYESVVDIKRVGKELQADISLLYIKKEDITLWGKLSYNMHSENIEANGAYRAYDLEGNFHFEKINNKVLVKLDANQTDSIEKVINRFIKKPKTNEWILRRILASSYQATTLQASGEIKRGEFKLDLDSIYGEAYATDVKVFFKKDLNQSANFENLKILYQKGALEFYPTKPTYKDKNLTHAKVVIEGIAKKKPKIHINLGVQSQFDKDINEILKAYKIKVPVEQSSGETNASIYIGVNLKTHKASFEGDFDLSKGKIKIANAPLDIDYAKVHYADKVVHIDDAYLHNTLYKGKVTGRVYIADKNASLHVDLDRFHVSKNKKKIIEAKKLSLPVGLSYHDGVKFTIDGLKTKIYTQEKRIVMDFDDISTIKEFVKVLPPDIDGGKLKLTTKKFQNFTLSGYGMWKECFLYGKKGVCHSRLPFKGTIKKGHLKLNLFKDKIKLFTYNDTIYVNGMHIDLDKLLSEKNKKCEANQQEYQPHKVTILGKNSTIRYKKYKLLTPHYTIDIYKDRVVFESIEGQKELYFKKLGSNITINANNIDDKMLHPLINFTALRGGKYALKMQGNFEKKMEGKITIEGGIVEKFQGYNNMVAFFNAIPALMTLSNPGFNDKGYIIKHGEIEYSVINQNIIRFKSIKIVGGSSTIVGAGEINIAKKSINMDLAIQTAREIGKVVGSIPIVGYILLGDGKSIAMGVTVRGSFDNPKIASQPIKDMVSLPFGMIERLLKSPKRLLEGNKKANSNP